MKSMLPFQSTYTIRWVVHKDLWGSLQQRSACLVLERKCFLTRRKLRSAVTRSIGKKALQKPRLQTMYSGYMGLCFISGSYW